MKRPATHIVSRRGELATTTLATAIRTARQARGLTQADLAERARISLPTVSRLERGHSGIALWAWLSAMEVLGLLSIFENLKDTTTNALMRAAVNKPVRRRKPPTDLEF
ncbi:MAG: helix-turn-helix transcriptional regulator [Thermomonas sp.]